MFKIYGLGLEGLKTSLTFSKAALYKTVDIIKNTLKDGKEKCHSTQKMWRRQLRKKRIEDKPLYGCGYNCAKDLVQNWEWQ